MGETKALDHIDHVIEYARSFRGTPYVYGGNNRLSGLDCSGFVCEVLRSFGLVGPHEDLSSQQLFDKLKSAPGSALQSPVKVMAPGLILFFQPKGNSKIDHVALCVDNLRMIEAGGGGRTCTDFQTAARFGAMVRERMISNRDDLVAAIFPAYPE